MNIFNRISKPLTWFTALLLVAGLAGCGGGNNAAAPASSGKAITNFAFVGHAGAPVIIDQAPTVKTIALTLPFGTNVTALVATYTTTGVSVKVGAALQTSSTTANNFASPVTYTVTAADGSTATYVVTVNMLAAAANPTPPVLGEAGRFVILAPAAITTTGVTTISNGDIGISPAARSLMTGFTPVGASGGVAELVNGTTYASNDANPAPFPLPLHFSTPVVGAPWTSTAAMLTQANTDLGIADTFLGADPNPSAVTQVCPTQLGGLTLTPGVYKTAANVLVSTGALTLDGQGNANAVFIFSIGGTLGTGAPGGNIVLVNGALAKNVYWRTAGITTIGAGTIFKGQVFAATQVNVNSGANITGSLYAITDRVTLIATTLTKAP